LQIRTILKQMGKQNNFWKRLDFMKPDVASCDVAWKKWILYACLLQKGNNLD